MTVPGFVREGARHSLAGIRLFNGAAALCAPAFLLRRLNLDADANPGGYYAFRMFGIRTILVGAELLLWGPDVRAHALRLAPLIHLSDTLSAAYAGLRRQIPVRTAIMATAISAVNVLLAILAQPPRHLPQTSSPSSAAPRDAARALASPVSRAADGRPNVTVDALLDMSQAERDGLFRAAIAGAIPDGDAEGTLLIASKPLFIPRGLVDRVAALAARRLAWSGKVFDAQKGELVNKVTRLQIRAFRAKVYKAPSWFDDRAAVILDYSKTSLLARRIRDEIRLVGPGTYLGQVYWGRARVLEFALVFPHREGAAA